MQQVSKVILFYTRRKICGSIEARAQIRRVKKNTFWPHMMETLQIRTVHVT
jgi:hypothetical protein